MQPTANYVHNQSGLAYASPPFVPNRPPISVPSSISQQQLRKKKQKDDSASAFTTLTHHLEAVYHHPTLPFCQKYARIAVPIEGAAADDPDWMRLADLHVEEPITMEEDERYRELFRMYVKKRHERYQHIIEKECNEMEEIRAKVFAGFERLVDLGYYNRDWEQVSFSDEEAEWNKPDRTERKSSAGSSKEVVLSPPPVPVVLEKEVIVRTSSRTKARKTEEIVEEIVAEPVIVTPEQPLDDRQIEVLRSKLWNTICKRHIPRACKAIIQEHQSRVLSTKRIATLCQREVKKANVKMFKTTKEIPMRSKRSMKEMLTFWKKNEKEDRDNRKKAEKEAMERRRLEEEAREAKRQARKLNFLITQTELYSHFIGKKLGGEVSESGPSDNQVDFDEDSDEKLKEAAARKAQDAVNRTIGKTKQFDQESNKLRNENDSMQVDIDEKKQVEQPKLITCQLKPYQLRGLNWLINLYDQGINGILADDMGLGKTVQSISLMCYLAETMNIWGPFLVIAPASTLHNWQQEIAKFAPEFKILPYWGSVNDRKILRKFWNPKKLYTRDSPFHVLVTSYQIVVTDEKHFQRLKWQYMILDEAHAIKSSTSARWQVLLGFHCRNRLLLTGTPIQNSMQELWALLHFIMPTLFDSHDEFSEWFSRDIESHAENKSSINEHQLTRLHMILKPFMLRRVKKDVEHELGEKIELTVKVELSARQRHMNKGLKDKISIADLLQKTSMNEDTDMDSLMNLVMQFRKVCNHPELFERAEVVSPFVFSIVPSIESQIVNGKSNCNPISFHIPKTIFRGLVQDLNAISIYHPSHTWNNEDYGFLKVANMSCGQLHRISRMSTFERYKYHIEENSSLRNSSPIFRTIMEIQNWDYSSRISPSYMPKVHAAPIDAVCYDRSFVIHQDAILYDYNIKSQLIRNDFLSEQGSIINSHGTNMIHPLWVPSIEKLVSDSAKLAYLDTLLPELKAKGHRVLIYNQMTRMIDIMEDYLSYRRYKYLRLDGSSKISDRRDMVSDFQTNPDIFCFLLSTRAGGLGINLTAADTVIFYDSDWNPTVDQQAMDRAHRLGQTKQVTVYRLICRNTIEERILERANQKDQIHKVVISGGEFKQDSEFKKRDIVSLLLDEGEGVMGNGVAELPPVLVKRPLEEEQPEESKKQRVEESFSSFTQPKDDQVNLFSPKFNLKQKKKPSSKKVKK